MKNNYIKPVCELEKFEQLDVITASTVDIDTSPNGDNETSKLPLNPQSEL